MAVVEGKKYYTQSELAKAVRKNPSVISTMVSCGALEKPAGIVGPTKIWNEAQVERIKQKLGSAA